jgi:hypothetical protein
MSPSLLRHLCRSRFRPSPGPASPTSPRRSPGPHARLGFADRSDLPEIRRATDEPPAGVLIVRRPPEPDAPSATPSRPVAGLEGGPWPRGGDEPRQRGCCRSAANGSSVRFRICESRPDLWLRIFSTTGAQNRTRFGPTICAARIRLCSTSNHSRVGFRAHEFDA